MNKKLLTLIMAVMMAMIAIVPLTASAAGDTMYVYTANGKGLNVRSSPNIGNNTIGSLPYGSMVTVDTSFTGNSTWTAIYYGGLGTAFVMSRYLVAYPPSPYTPQPAPAPAPSSDTMNGTTVNELNRLVENAVYVTPYTVTVRPTRTSGWVYLRWMPSRNSQMIQTLVNNEQVTVIAELTDWYQVVVPESGRTGFIYKSYVQ